VENDLRGMIQEKDIKKGFNSSKDLKRTYAEQADYSSLVLFDLVKEKKTIHSGTLWNVYLEVCKFEEESVWFILGDDDNLFLQIT